MQTELHFGSTIAGGAWIFAITIAVTAVVVGTSIRRGAERDSIIQRVLTVWLIASLAGVAMLTLQPGQKGFDGPRPSIFNPISRLSKDDAVANVILYVPVGLFAALVWRTKTRVVVWATGFAFAVSFTIEFAQWVLPIDRAATTHDVISNTLGGFVGAALGTLVVRMAQRPSEAVLSENE